MDVDELVEPEAALAAAATAVLFSPPVRALVRRGAIGGLAGLLAAADTLRAAARVLNHGLERPPVWAARGLQDITDRPQTTDDAAASGTPRA